MFHFPTPPMPRRNRPKTPMSLYSFWLLPEPSSQLPLPLLLLSVYVRLRQLRRRLRQQPKRIQAHRGLRLVPPGHRWCREMEHLHTLVRVDIFRVDLVTEHSRLQVQVRIIKGLTLQQQQERQSMRLRQEQLFQPDMPEMRETC